MIFLLLGMTASGKSTIGCTISKLLKCQFIDLDERIAQDVNMSVRSFYEKYGKELFQQRENDMLKKVMLTQAEKNKDLLVISAGGGLIENKESIDFLLTFLAKKTQDAIIFFLDMPAKILWKRLLKKAEKGHSFPSFLKITEGVQSSSLKMRESLRLYRAKFLFLYKKRLSLFRMLCQKIGIIKIKCKGKKQKQIARFMIRSAKVCSN